MITEQNSVVLYGDDVVEVVTPITENQMGSVRLSGNKNAMISRSVSKPSTSYRKGAISIWFKRGRIEATTYQHLFQSSLNSSPYRSYAIMLDPSDSLVVNFQYQVAAGANWNTSINFKTSAKLRDTTNWYHAYLFWDTTKADMTQRAGLKINGKTVTAFDAAIYPTLNESLLIDSVGFNTFIGHTDGVGVYTDGISFDGCFSNYVRTDGFVPSVGEFGYFDENGHWKAKPYGTNTGAEVDPYYDDVIIYLPLDGVDGDRVFKDYGPNSVQMSVWGDPVQTSDAPIFGKKSLFGNGTDKFLYLPYSALWDLGTNDFTIELQLYATSDDASYILSCSEVQFPFWTLSRNGDGTLRFACYDGQGVVTDLTTTLTVPKLVVTHVAIQRRNLVVEILINKQKSAVTGDNVPRAYSTVNARFFVGAVNMPGPYWSGAIGHLRVTRNVARYASGSALITGPFPTIMDKLGVNGFAMEFKDRTNMATFLNDSSGSKNVLFSESFDTLGDWVVSQGFNGTGGTATVASGYLKPVSFGSGSGWHGPLVTKTIPALSDFDVTFTDVNFGNVSSDIVHMTLMVGDVCYFSMSDAWDNGTPNLEGYTFGNWTQSSQNTYTETLVGANVRLVRIGNMFYGYMNGILKYQVQCLTKPVTTVSIQFSQYVNYPSVSMAIGGVEISGVTPNKWTTTGITLTGSNPDAFNDVPHGFVTPGYGNCLTLDPWSQRVTNVSVSLYEANLRASLPVTNGGDLAGISSTHPLQDGQYFEATVVEFVESGFFGLWFGLCDDPMAPLFNFVGINHNYSGSGAAPGIVSRLSNAQNNLVPFTLVQGDVYGFAYRNGKVWIRRNGVWLSGVPDSGVPSFIFNGPNIDKIFATIAGRDGGSSVRFNFGQYDFVNAVPQGFHNGTSSNWVTPVHPKPSLYHDTTIYIGDGTNQRDTQLLGFVPEVSWHKGLSTDVNHILFNFSRGNDKGLIPNLHLGESPYSGYHQFGPNGRETLSYSGSAGPSYEMNKASVAYSVWGWKAGNDVGLTTVLYNGTPGSQVLTHGQNLAPEVAIYKRLDSDGDWLVETTVTGSMTRGHLNRTYAFGVSDNPLPTNSSVTLSAGSLSNIEGARYQAMFFRSIRGYSKFGIWRGMSSTKSPSVYCGFKPRFLLVKQMTGVDTHWFMLDSLRSKFNPLTSQIEANLTNMESFAAVIDFTSTGFVIRNSSAGAYNGAGDTYFFMAFAEAPSKFGLAC